MKKYIHLNLTLDHILILYFERKFKKFKTLNVKLLLFLLTLLSSKSTYELNKKSCEEILNI